jgi:hypothetical protein
LEQSDEGFTDHAKLAEDDDDSYHDMAIEFGEFSLALASHSHILGDESASVTTLGIPPPSDYQTDDTDNNSDMDTFEDGKPGAPSTVTKGSSLTNTTPQLSVNDSIANLLANTSLDPTIRQAILNSQKDVDTARGDS